MALINQQQSCIKCGNIANLMCSRCFESYCGKSCQIGDWHQHKLLCENLFDDGAKKKRNHMNATAKLYIELCRTREKEKKKNDYQTFSVDDEKEEKEEDCQTNDETCETLNETTTTSIVNKSNINKEILELDIDLPKKHFTYSDIRIVPLPTGNYVQLIITNMTFIDQFIFSAMVSNKEHRRFMAKDFKKLTKYCKKASKTKRGYKPKLNEMCLALFEEDSQWYRACCFNDENSKINNYTLQFIDFGNLCNVSSDDIMPITEELMFPCYNNFCRIVNKEKIFKLKANENYTPINCKVSLNDESNIYEIYVKD